MTREQDLGKALQALGRRMSEEGQATSQRFHDWKRVEQIARDSSRGGGNGGIHFDTRDRQQDRQAARMAAEWARTRQQLDALTQRAVWLMDQAKADHRPLDKHRTPAQVEADGWCGHCWQVASELVPVTLRPSGEPYYRGRCRFCGSWPGGDPPSDVVRTRLAGRRVSVKAS